MPRRPRDETLKPFLVYIDGEVRRQLKIKAASMGTTMAALVREALAREVATVSRRR